MTTVPDDASPADEPSSTTEPGADDRSRPDPVIARLRAADPVTPSSLPSADDPAALRILEHAMSTSTREADQGQPFGPPPVQPHGPSPSGSGRKWGQLAAVAAAALILIMGVVVLSPSNSEPALAAVHNAAEVTAEANTGRATTTFSAADGTSSEQASGEATLVFAERDLSFTIDFTELSDLELDDPNVVNPLTGGLEGRLVDGVLYAQFGGQWMAVEAPALLTDMALDVADPRTILLTAQDLLDTEEIGSTTIDGVEVTHYQSVVDLGDDTVGQAGWLGGLENQLDVEADGEVTVDLYVDGQGRMYRIDVTGDLVEPEGPGTAVFEISTVFTDLGTDLTIEAPAGVDVLDLSDFGIEDEDFATDEEN